MATLTLRAVKGAPLTSAEVDNNFSELNNNKVQLGGDIGGSTSSPTVIKLSGRTFSSASPTTGQAIVWSGAAWQPGTVASSSGNTGITVLDDISNQFAQNRRIFTLKNNRIAITEGINYVDNKDFTVQIGGQLFNAAVPQTTTLGPWISLYVAERARTYRVTGSRIIFYSHVAKSGQSAEIRINTVSASRQTRSRYPLSPNTIVLGD
jgi:hypothetical protein